MCFCLVAVHVSMRSLGQSRIDFIFQCMRYFSFYSNIVYKSNNQRYRTSNDMYTVYYSDICTNSIKTVRFSE